jgi:ATP-binding cassette, subfamily F, member 3
MPSMTIVELSNIRKSFGPNNIINGVSWQLDFGDKIALVGMNGSGKTTLIKIIAGIMPPDSGTVRVNNGLRIGYVPQKPIFNTSTTLKEYISDQEFENLRQNIKQIEEEISLLKDDETKLLETLDRYNLLQTEFENRDGFRYESRLETILSNMGFNQADLNKPLNALSGGQKSRAQLAKALLQQPDLLLLDEPDSHLDIDALEWLENLLYNYKSSVIVISHDRYLLENATNKTIEIEYGNLHQYNGNYTYYTDQKQRAMTRQHYDYVNQQLEITHLKEAIESLRNWSAKSSNPKLGRRVRSMEKRLEWINPVDKPHKKPKMQLAFDYQKRSGDMVVEAIDLSKKFGDQVLFSNISFHVRWGDHIAIVGPNGSGKTTFIKILLGLEEPTNGQVYLGENLIISYFDQEQQGLNNQGNIYDEFENTNLTKNERMYLLSKMLFRGDKAFKKINELSGGERNRVMLSKLVYTKANLIVMDEPTNHLDIPSIEMLEEALIAFRGTVILVSHDRHLLSKVSDTIIEINSGEAKVYSGGYDYYYEFFS